jgi:hypothetical protein
LKKALEKKIKETVSIEEQNLEFVTSLFKPMYLKKDELFHKGGSNCKEYAFIVKGGPLRSYYIDINGEEISRCFFFENEFVFSIYNLTEQIQIQAVQDTQLLVISKADLNLIYRKIPNADEFGLKEMEKAILKMEKRISALLTSSASDRYENLVNNDALLLKTVPLKYLASYLGISPQHLSRLRKSKNSLLNYNCNSLGFNKVEVNHKTLPSGV